MQRTQFVRPTVQFVCTASLGIAAAVGLTFFSAKTQAQNPAALASDATYAYITQGGLHIVKGKKDITKRIELPSETLTAVALSGNGNWLIAATADKRILLYDLTAPLKEEVALAVRKEASFPFVTKSLAASDENGRLFFAASDNKSLYTFQWKAAEEAPSTAETIVEQLPAPLTALTCNSSYVVGADSRGEVQTYLFSTGAKVAGGNAKVSAPVRALVLSKDSALVAALDKTNLPKRWSLSNGKMRLLADKSNKHSDSNALAFDNRNQLLFAPNITPESTDAATSAATGESPPSNSDPRILLTIPNAHSAQPTPYVNALSFSEHGDWLVSGGRDGAVKVWALKDLPTFDRKKSRFSELEGNKFVQAVVLTKTQEGYTVYAGGRDNQISCMDFNPNEFENASRLTPFQEDSQPKHQSYVMALAWNEKRNLLASAGADGKLFLWARSGLKVDGIPVSKTLALVAVAFSPDGNRVAVACLDDNIYVYDIDGKNDNVKLTKPRTLSPPKSEHRDGDQMLSVAFLNHDTLIAGGKRGRLFIAVDNVQDESKLPVLQLISGGSKGNKSGDIYCIETNGRVIATGAEDKRISLWNWNAKSVTALGQLEKHAGTVRALAFSKNGKRLASGGADSQIIIWDMDKVNASLRAKH